MVCEDGCSTSTAQPGSTGDQTPTTGDSADTVTGDSVDHSSGSTAPDAEGGTDTIDTTGEPAELPLIVSRVVMPDYTDKNALLDVSVTAENAKGVRMLLDNGDEVELTPGQPGEFDGGIAAFTGLDNGKHTAIFTPWRDVLVGESKGADYVIALPPPGYEVSWQAGAQDIDGRVVAIEVLPDGRPVELGTYFEAGEPRCYLRLRDETGEPIEFVPVLPPAHCTAVDLTIDRDTGVMHVLVERKSGDGLKWWVGEFAGWGTGPKNIGIGEVGDTALALASRPGLVAVCGAKPVATIDERDALAVLLRPGQPAQERLFDYRPKPNPHLFGEIVRDCTFAGDTLVLVGEANGKHDPEFPNKHDRLVVIEYDVAAESEPVWTVAGPGPGVQSRGLALDIDDEGRYHLAGYTCLETCAPEGEYRVYSPGGKLEWQASLGPLGSDWFGPHDIAWSPAGYVVVALGAMQGKSSVFKVQALTRGLYMPLWTFIPNDKQVPQMALAVAIGLHGEVYAGGIGAMNHPAFAVIGS
ncbi:MAG TPA: hypothetical protein VGB85_16095 [Nannocystis sp.]